jgi:hypothetical protein
MKERSLPPVAELLVVSIALMMIGGIYLAAQTPGHPSLAAPVGLVAAGGAMTATGVVLLSRIRPFAWSTFSLVMRWALLAYLIIAGMIEFVFIRDHAPGSTVAVLSVALFFFAVDVPAILAFTVAKFASPEEAEPSAA